MNAVYRHDFSDIVEVEEEGSAKALEQGESKNAMLTDDVENWKKEATTTFGFSSLLQGSTTLATIGATLISLMVFWLKFKSAKCEVEIEWMSYWEKLSITKSLQ